MCACVRNSLTSSDDGEKAEKILINGNGEKEHLSKSHSAILI